MEIHFPGRLKSDIPTALKPLAWLYAWILGFIIFVYIAILHFTCRFEFLGEEKLSAVTGPLHGSGRGRSRGAIFTMWHHNWMPYFGVNIRHRKHAWICHTHWTSYPIVILLRFIRIEKVFMGSAGHGGKEAVAQVIQYLKEGYSTVMTPDGPLGPPRVLKEGVLQMALESRVPIIPMKFITPRAVVFRNTWDGKRFPLPFSKITVHYEQPILVNSPGEIPALAAKLTAAMG